MASYSNGNAACAMTRSPTRGEDASTTEPDGRTKKRKRMDLLIEKSRGLERHHETPRDPRTEAQNSGIHEKETEAAQLDGRDQATSELGQQQQQLSREHSSSGDALIARKCTWMPQEDAKLIELVSKHGRDWAVVAQYMGSRDRKRCRERFINHLDPALSRLPWTEYEDNRLKQLQTEQATRNQWAKIAKLLGGRGPEEVKYRSFQLMNNMGASIERADEPSGSRKAMQWWTRAEADKLRALVDAHGAKDWFFVASQLPGRTDLQCRQHWYRVLLPSITKGKGTWTVEEDTLLSAKVKELGPRWTEIAELLPGRLGKQCRERYLNHVDPSINKGPWTLSEEAVLLQAQQANPNKWTLIATRLSGRSENAIKNHWNAMQRKRHSRGSADDEGSDDGA